MLCLAWLWAVTAHSLARPSSFAEHSSGVHTSETPWLGSDSVNAAAIPTSPFLGLLHPPLCALWLCVRCAFGAPGSACITHHTRKCVAFTSTIRVAPSTPQQTGTTSRRVSVASFSCDGGAAVRGSPGRAAAPRWPRVSRCRQSGVVRIEERQSRGQRHAWLFRDQERQADTWEAGAAVFGCAV